MKFGPLTDVELDEMEATTNAATTGRWLVSDVVPKAIVASANPTMSLLGLDPEGYAIVMKMADAEFIAEAKSYVPRLIAEVRRLRSEHT